MSDSRLSTAQKDTRDGVVVGLLAYFIWGFLPVYFKIVGAVEPNEVIAHRVMWAIPFGALLIALRRQWREVLRGLTHKSMLGWLAVSSLLIGLNWFIYIWAIQDDRIFETSLGYYINPLTNMLVGVVFLGERLRRLQGVAVALAAAGVLVLSVKGGQIPWVSLVLAISFTAYAVIRKKVAIGGMPGLFIETLLLLPFAIGWYVWLEVSGQVVFARGAASLTFWLVMAGPVTVVPLLLFALAARRLPLTTIGFMQFLAPTMQFAAGMYYGESLTIAHLVCFACIWIAVILFSYDAIQKGRKKPPQAGT